MGRKRKHEDGSYWTLAEGPGSLGRAARLAAEQQRPSEPAPPPPQPSSAEAGATPPRASPEYGPHEPIDDAAHGEATAGYRRMLEELSHFLMPARARQILDAAVRQIGMSPDTVESYDLRMAMLEEMPKQLEAILKPREVDAVLQALEEALVDMQAPRRVHSSGRPRTSSSPSMPPA